MHRWRNWQTRTVQVRVGVTPWRFESSSVHQTNIIRTTHDSLFLSVTGSDYCFFLFLKFFS